LRSGFKISSEKIVFKCNKLNLFLLIIPFVGLILSIVGMSKYKTEAMKKKCKTSLIVSIVVWAINFIILLL
jgi:hypothetical protein